MRADAYDAYDAYDNDSYDAYDAYSERFRPPARRPATYGTNAAVSAGTARGDFVTKADLALALTPVSKDVNDVRSQIAGLGKRVESALVKIDKDTTNARRDMGSAKRTVQSAQMMALLPMLLQNNTPPALTQTQKGLRVILVDSKGKELDTSKFDQSTNLGALNGASAIIVDEDGKEVKPVTDVQYAPSTQQQGLAGNNNMMLVLMMMMMGGGFGGGSSEGKEFGGTDNNMMMMMLLLVMMRPQSTTLPPTVPAKG